MCRPRHLAEPDSTSSSHAWPLLPSSALTIPFVFLINVLLVCFEPWETLSSASQIPRRLRPTRTIYPDSLSSPHTPDEFRMFCTSTKTTPAKSTLSCRFNSVSRFNVSPKTASFSVLLCSHSSQNFANPLPSVRISLFFTRAKTTRTSVSCVNGPKCSRKRCAPT